MSQASAPVKAPLIGFLASMSALKARLLLLLVSAVFISVFLYLFSQRLTLLEESIGSAGWLLEADSIPEERINIIAIDERSIDELGPWPWSRATMAQLSIALAEAGVQQQIYDIVFDQDKQGDAAFLAALTAGNAVLGQVPVLEGQGHEAIRSGSLGYPVAGVNCSAQALPQAQSYIANAASYASIPAGHLTPLFDADGAVRFVPSLICADGKAYPALAISTLLVATGANSWDVSIRSAGGLGPALEMELPSYPGLSIPLDKQGNIRVAYNKDPSAYSYISAVDIIDGKVDPSLLANTWALIGHTAFGMVDIVPTPYRGDAPGVEVQARILGSLLDNNVPYTPVIAPLLQLALSGLFAMLLLLVAGRKNKSSGFQLALCAVVFPLLAVVAHVELLSFANIWLGWLPSALFGMLAAALFILYEYGTVRFERARVLTNLKSYLPVDVATQIAYSLPKSSIEASRQNVTLLSADLRNFSAFSEARPPEEAAAVLHFFFVRATEIIEQCDGQVHEFKGDGLLALWSGSDASAASNALRAAEKMQVALQDILPQTPPTGLEPLALGIGIEQGPVLIGSIGPAHRRSHALLGETVTITLRIQEMTAELAQAVLIGECAARQLTGSELQSQGSYLLEGLQNPHTLFAPAPGQAMSGHNGSRTAPPALKLLYGGRQQ